VPDRAVAGIADCSGWEFVIGRLQFLKTDDVRSGLFQPPEQIDEPSVDAVERASGTIIMSNEAV
jgi:hypothetical protein